MMWWILGLMATIYAVIFVYKTRTGSPYVPSNIFQIETMAKYIEPGDVIADMGCGDGRVLIAAINKGASEAHGWEIEPAVWLKGWLRVRKAGLQDRVRVVYGDMWKADLSLYDVVFVYQLEQFGKKFVDKCRTEMKPGSMVIANTYPLEGLKLKKKDGPLLIYSC